MKAFTLPKEFELGSATASLQIEGGDKNNNWFDWCSKNHIRDGSSCLRANDHYNRVEEDIELMKELNHSCYRMSLEWSRIEPEEGVFSDEAVAHYRQELALLREAGIRPIITLFHFSYPLWFANAGAFENKACIERFMRYVRFCVEAFGDLCEEWIPVNEPNVFATMGYLGEGWPPGKNKLFLAIRVMRNLILCHLKAYKLIHEIRNERGWTGRTMVGSSMHLRVFDPVGISPFNRLAAKLVERMFQGAAMHATITGVFKFPLGRGAPCGKGVFCDFAGINYYTRDMVRFSLRKGYKLSVHIGAQVNNLGWEIYPEGLYRLCKDNYKRYGLPIFITENGTCDSDDSFRARYICDHLRQVSRLIDEGIPVERYYHWTLIDNFEWLEGESARFGLVRCNFKTQKRTIRKSGKLYAEISREKALTEDMIKRYGLS